MKLKSIHLFIILLGALLLCSSLGVFMRTEGFQNNDNDSYFQDFKNDVESPFEPKHHSEAGHHSETEHHGEAGRSGHHMNPKHPMHPGHPMYPHHGEAGHHSGHHGEPHHPMYPGHPSHHSGHSEHPMHPSHHAGHHSETNHKKPKKHTDDNSDIYDYNSSKYKHHKQSSYIGPAGDTVLVDSPRKHHKSTSLGIPSSQIPSGSEDLYILKSEVIPPVCPMCPSMSACPNKEPPPPCPPCARCPEPAFDCKKVPNYNNTDNRYLPVPVLSDFSQFGM
jgi:hypothetical protein